MSPVIDDIVLLTLWKLKIMLKVIKETCNVAVILLYFFGTQHRISTTTVVKPKCDGGLLKNDKMNLWIMHT